MTTWPAFSICGRALKESGTLYEGNATGKIPDKHFTRLLAEYDEEQTGLEAAIAQWQEAIEGWNADRLKTDKFIELVSRYTDFSELTTPRKNRQHKAWYERQKAAQPPKPRTLKELAAALDAGQPLTPEETERLEASRNRKKNAYQELKTQAETDPAAAAELARRRAYHSEAT